MTSPDVTPPPPEPALRGLSLVRLAGVHAGLAEGLPIAKVLAHEGVDPAAWERGESLWLDKLAEDADAEGPLQDAYDDRLAAARLRYGRRVSPLDEDLRAWAAFVGALSRAEDVPAMLRELELRPTDLLRLHAAWSKRLGEDAALRARAERLFAAEPGPLPALTIEARAPGPPPAEDALVELPLPADADEDDLEDDLEDVDEDDDDEATEGEDATGDDAPPLFVPMEGWGVEPGAAPEPRSIGAVSPPAAVPSGIEAPPPAAPRAVPSFLAAQAASPPPAAPLSPPAAAAPPRQPALSMGTMIGEISPFAALPALPFAAAKRPAPPPIETIDAEEDDGGEGGTVIGQAVNVAEALPFRPGAAPAAPPSAPGAAARQPPMETIDAAEDDEGGTMIGAAVNVGALLPFQRGPASPVAAGASRAEPPSPPSSAPDASIPAAPADVTAEASPSPLKGTVLPFRSPAPPPAASAPAPVSNTAVPNPAAAPPNPSAALTVEQYAALCAELAVVPGRAEETFRRYGLAGLRERLAVDLAWQERLRRNPDEHHAWATHYRRYHAELSRKLGKG